MNVGEQVQIELTSGEPLNGSISWARDWEIGIDFDGLIDVEAVLATPSINEKGERPRLPRIPVSCPARLRTGGRIHNAALIDISQNGAKVRTRTPVKVGKQVLVTLPDLPPMRGIIPWVNETIAGVAFDESIPFEALTQWLEGRQNRRGDHDRDSETDAPTK